MALPVLRPPFGSRPVSAPFTQPRPGESAPAAPPVATATDGSAGAALAAMVRPHLLPLPTQDDVETRLRALLAEAVPRVIRHEVVTSDRPPVTIEGAQHSYFPLVLAVVSSGVPLMLWGGAGSGKTTLATNAARALDRRVLIQSFTADTSRAEVLGYVLPGNGQVVRTPLRDAFEHGGCYVADEFDAGGPGLVALNAATANGACAFAGDQVAKHTAFQFIGTANTNGNGAADGYQRQRIDAALLDRLFVVHLPHDKALERSIVGLPPGRVTAPPCIVSDGAVPSVDEWHDVVERFRDALRSLGVKAPVLGSNRAPRLGEALIRAGVGMRWLCHGLLRKGGISDETWQKAARIAHLPENA